MTIITDISCVYCIHVYISSCPCVAGALRTQGTEAFCFHSKSLAMTPETPLLSCSEALQNLRKQASKTSMNTWIEWEVLIGVASFSGSHQEENAESCW